MMVLRPRAEPWIRRVGTEAPARDGAEKATRGAAEGSGLQGEEGRLSPRGRQGPAAAAGGRTGRSERGRTAAVGAGAARHAGPWELACQALQCCRRGASAAPLWPARRWRRETWKARQAGSAMGQEEAS